ncbi:EF-hand domain-containing protein [Streptomyces sp. LP05-1]|uniref:EF-hand domain-containing protein n=1 Tax=Streptomyces pyxinae TaxID=2970734 RepID=A0ABT2CQP0_9ACTN|nr:EF-hand domain-containing protein [Streptomyces sp. LP05-1]MCS0639761.1 EF-hand domain-containing protein [Streptomyces sp. LP05-1]
MSTAATDRVGLVFSLLDANGNGVIEADDFELMAGRVIAAAPASDDAAKSALLHAFRRYWTTLATELDADGDGRVDLDEFTSCVLSPERFEATLGEFAEALAALGDPDGRGSVDRTVFTALMTAIGFERANIDALFDALSPSPEDRVPVTAWADSIRDYYDPQKTGIAGDRLVTPGAP